MDREEETIVCRGPEASVGKRPLFQALKKVIGPSTKSSLFGTGDPSYITAIIKPGT